MNSYLRAAEPAAESRVAHQARVDRLVEMARAELAIDQAQPVRRELFVAPPPLDFSDDPLDHRITEEIDYARRHIDVVGDILAGNGFLLNKHGRELQSLDLVNQLLGYLGRVIVAQDRLAAVNAITLEDLRARLQRRSFADEEAAAQSGRSPDIDPRPM